LRFDLNTILWAHISSLFAAPAGAMLRCDHPEAESDDAAGPRRYSRAASPRTL
jgi:hypothetical protein